MISISKLGKSYGGRALFEDVSLQLNAGARYGLVGANGSGKTTFLSILAGDEPASRGQRHHRRRRARVGVLRQDRFLDDEQDHPRPGDDGRRHGLGRAAGAARASSITARATPTRLAELEDTLAHSRRLHARGARHARCSRGSASRSRVAPPAAVDALGRLQAARAARAGARRRPRRAAARRADQPPRHPLDPLAREVPRRRTAAARVVISHDQRFLDNVATHILDVDYGTITLYTGNYAAFVVEKAGDPRRARRREIARAEEEIARQARLRRALRRQGDQGHAGAEPAQADREDRGRGARGRARAARRCSASSPSGRAARDVLEVAGVSQGVRRQAGARATCRSSCGAASGSAIIGPNGLGKSTLLKIVDRATLEADAGEVELGPRGARRLLRAGPPRGARRTQTRRRSTTSGRPCPGEGTAFVRGQLGRVLFSGDDVEEADRHRSRAARRRGSSSAGSSSSKPNVLVLDEPTNHLDLEAIEALVEALQAYEGTLLFVSHDRWFVSELATRILEVTPTGPRDFPGTYAEYLARCGDDHLDAEAVLERAPSRRQGEGGRQERGVGGAEARAQPHRGAAGQARQGAGAHRGRRGAQEGDRRALRRSDASISGRRRRRSTAGRQRARGSTTEIEKLVAEWEAIEAELSARA